MLQNKETCAKYDLSSVRLVYSGAAPLGDETIRDFKKVYPTWTIAQAYGNYPSIQAPSPLPPPPLIKPLIR